MWISSFCKWVIIELSTGINDNSCAHWVKPKINSCDQEFFSRLSCTSNLKHLFKLINKCLHIFINNNNNNNESYDSNWKTGRLWTQFIDRNNSLEALSQIKCRFRYAYLGLGDWNGKLTLIVGITSSEISKTLLCTSTSYDESVPLEFC